MTPADGANLSTNDGPKNRKSYAEVVNNLGFRGKDAQEAISALHILGKRGHARPTRPNISANPPPPVCVYVQGIAKGPLSEVRRCLRALRFRSTAIYNISFVGSITAEVLIPQWYLTEFRRQAERTGIMSILDDYNASGTLDPNATDEIRKKIKEAFVRRILKLTSSSEPAVRSFYLDIAKKAGISFPATSATTSQCQ
jgi:hypothetical protein